MMIRKDPRQCAETVLDVLVGVNDARAGAVFDLEKGVPSLYVSRGVSQPALDWTDACWRREGDSLRTGRLSRSDTRILIPVHRGEHLVGLLYLEVAQADLASVAEFSGLLADAVTRDSASHELASPVEEYLERTPTEEIERRRLLLLLDRFEWNVARVARELRISRTTLYKRLAGFGIPRQRVPKQPRRNRPLARSRV